MERCLGQRRRGLGRLGAVEKKPGVRSLEKSPENKTPFPGGFCTNNRVVKTEAVRVAIQMKSNSLFKVF